MLTCAVLARLAGKPDERLGQTVTVTAVAAAGVATQHRPGAAAGRGRPRPTDRAHPGGGGGCRHRRRGDRTVRHRAGGARRTTGATGPPWDRRRGDRGGCRRVDRQTGLTLGCDVVIELGGRTSDALTAHLEVVVAAPPAAVPATARAVLGSGANADLPWTVTTGPPGGDTVTVHPSYECASGLKAVALPTEVTVARGEPARLVDRVTVEASARPGDVLDCTVTVAVDAYPVSRRVSVLVSGADPTAATLPVARGGPARSQGGSSSAER